MATQYNASAPSPPYQMAVNVCPVCITTYSSRERERARVTLCGHVLCEGCIDTLLSRWGKCCPLCRSREWAYIGYPFGGLPVVYILNDMDAQPSKPRETAADDGTHTCASGSSSDDCYETYTKSDYIQYYGEKEGVRAWEYARTLRREKDMTCMY